jgi:hypothetical protein
LLAVVVTVHHWTDVVTNKPSEKDNEVGGCYIAIAVDVCCEEAAAAFVNVLQYGYAIVVTHQVGLRTKDCNADRA